MLAGQFTFPSSAMITYDKPRRSVQGDKPSYAAWSKTKSPVKARDLYGIYTGFIFLITAVLLKWFGVYCLITDW